MGCKSSSYIECMYDLKLGEGGGGGGGGGGQGTTSNNTVLTIYT